MKDVTSKIRCGWIKWQKATRVLCDKKIPLKVKEEFYSIVMGLWRYSGEDRLNNGRGKSGKG